MIDFSVSNWWFSTALIVSASSPFRSPVVPKVPSRHAAAGAARDLGDLRRAQPARRVAVELVQLGEGDMVHIHVQPHADGVGRDQEIDLAVLIERHLGVAGAGLSAPSTTALPPRRRRISSAMA